MNHYILFSSWLLFFLAIANSKSNEDIAVRLSCHFLQSGGPITIVSSSSIIPTLFNRKEVFNALNKTLDDIKRSHTNVYTSILCGSSLCMEIAKSFVSSNRCLSYARLILPTLATGTPVEAWIREHSLVKILSMQLYESQLQLVTQLLILWHFGGKVIPLGVKIDFSIATKTSQWIIPANIQVTNIEKESVYSLCNIRMSHVDIVFAMSGFRQELYAWKLLSTFADAYSLKYNKLNWPLSIDWRQIFQSHCHLFLHDVTMTNKISLQKKSYGTYSYNLRRKYLKERKNNGMNIGDEMQGIAGIQFLPYLSRFIELDDNSVSFVNSSSIIKGKEMGFNLIFCMSLWSILLYINCAIYIEILIILSTLNSALVKA